MLAEVGVQCIKLPPRSPNLNAYAERFVRSINQSCLERLILFGERALRTAINDYVEHYHRERHHQGLGNRLIVVDSLENAAVGPLRCRQRLGGILNFYYREAA